MQTVHYATIGFLIACMIWAAAEHANVDDHGGKQRRAGLITSAKLTWAR
jgi:hypothetical protein